MGALLTQFMNRYAYTDFHELNADWMIRTMMELINQVENFVSLNAIKYADPIQWNITSQYEKNTVVIDPLSGTAYISVQPVPMGVSLTNTDYWTVVFDLGSFVVRAAKNFTNRYEEDTTTTATFASNQGDWLVWGDTLYEVIIPTINAGDQYVIDSNIRHITMEEVCDALAQAIDAIDTKVGDLDDLTTTDKSSIVNAINEVAAEVLGKIGDLNDLNTTDKDTLVDAINEVLGDVGDLTNLNTTDQTSVVNAINEVLGDVGDLTNLNTTDQTNVVNAINEVNSKWATPQMYGAVGDGVTDDYQAFVDCFANNKLILIPAGNYLINNVTAINMISDQLVICAKGAIIHGTVNSGYLLRGNYQNNITLIGGVWVGANTYDPSDGCDGLYFGGCENVIVDGVEVYDFGRVGFSFSGCLHCKIVNSNVHNNGHYGIRAYSDSADIIIANNISSHNGTTTSGVGSTYGRGINLGKVDNVVIANNIVYDNSEYGVRLYEETSYNKGCYDININNNQIFNNEKVNLLLYSESDTHKRVVMTNNIIGDVVSGTAAVSLHGDDLLFNDNIIKTTVNALNFYGCNGILNGNKINTSGVAASFGSLDCVVDISDNYIEAIGLGSLNSHFDGSVIKGNTIVCPVDSTGQSYYGVVLDQCVITLTNNVIKGFTRNIVFNAGTISSGALIITDNTLIDATGSHIYAYSEINEHLVVARNKIIGTGNEANKLYLAGMIDCGDTGLVPKRLLRLNQAPTTGSWDVGDMVINVSPTNDLASVIAWVCTAAGTPGTWRSLTSPT